jgi:ubiquinone/menaquinone biosynthesis C-methylase UbiE
MTNQKQVFLAGEGDAYFRRNADRLVTREHDVVVAALRENRIAPRDVLEIGCANGHRLATLSEVIGGNGAGIDPSREAVEAGRAKYPNLDLRVGTADKIPFADASFDLVIFGFCFYLVDPSSHFQAVAEADRVLRDGGSLVILDFVTPVPYTNDYVHMDGLKSHKMEFARYFTAHPAYTLVSRRLELGADDRPTIDNRIGVDLLFKDMKTAFPPNPFKTPV